MMKLVATTLVVVLALTTAVSGKAVGIKLFGSGKTRVRSELKASVDLGKLHRFAMKDQQTAGPVSPAIRTPDDRMREGLVTELDAHGFQFVPADNADFLVSYYTTVAGERVGPAFWDAATTAAKGPDGSQGARQLKDASIALEVFNATDQQLIWRGEITGRVGAADASGVELDNTRLLVNQFLKDVGVTPANHKGLIDSIRQRFHT